MFHFIKYFFFFSLFFILQSCVTDDPVVDDTGENPPTELPDDTNTDSEDDSEDDSDENNSDEASAVSVHGQLSIKGGTLVDYENQPVQLKGMSLFWSQWQPQFYNHETVKNLKEFWNISIIRAAMGVEHDGYLENPEREKEKVTRIINSAIDLGLYVIVDWHDHHAEDHLDEAKRFFSEIAREYGHHPNIIYEIYNEPLEVSWSNTLKPYHQEVIAAIRKYDNNNIIVCGTPSWSQRVDLAAEDPIQGDNIAYTLHFYAGTHKDELRQIAQQAMDKGIALFVTEYGTTNADGDGAVYPEETKKWWKFMEHNQLSWANWSIADKDEASAAVFPGTTPSQLTDPEHITTSGKLVRSQLLEDNE